MTIERQLFSNRIVNKQLLSESSLWLKTLTGLSKHVLKLSMRSGQTPSTLSNSGALNIRKTPLRQERSPPTKTPTIGRTTMMAKELASGFIYTLKLRLTQSFPQEGRTTKSLKALYLSYSSTSTLSYRRFATLRSTFSSKKALVTQIQKP